MSTGNGLPPDQPPTRPDAPDDDRTVLRPGLRAAAPPPADEAPTQAVPRTVPPALDFDADAHGNGLPVGSLLAEFEITSLLGEGGFGIVYLATDRSLGRRVALKEYMPAALASRGQGTQVQVRSARHRETFELGLRSFVNEARLLAQFDHPALVKVYRFWEANGTAYMVMPYYEGTTLRDLLHALPGPPDEAWLRDLLAPLTEALQVIHAEQCYHRDIAPDNVMMLGGAHDRPLLLDFGAARRVIGDMTQALTVILKPGYAPVEQYAEIPGMKQGPWTDVYALAAVVYFAITGRTPPPSVGRLLNDTYEPLAARAAGAYSERFVRAIDRALAVRPEERTPSVEALRADLGLGQAQFDAYSTKPMPVGSEMAAAGEGAAGLSGFHSSAAPSGPPAAARSTPGAISSAASAAGAASAAAAPPARRRSGVAVAAGIVLLVALGGGAAVWFMRDAPPGASDATAPAPAAVGTAAAPTAPGLATAPAPTSTPAPEAAATPSALDVEAEFARVVQAADASFDVQLRAPKTTLRIGRDELRFSVRSAREGYLYVLAHGSDGSLLQLYPNTESGSLRARPGVELELPRSPIVLGVTDPPGPGHLLVMVSPRQRDLSALAPKAEGPFRLFPVDATAAQRAAAHAAQPAALPWMAGRAVCPNGSACEDIYGAAMLRVDAVR